MALPRVRRHSITSAADDRDDERGPHRRRAEQQAGADAGDRDVADAVAHQRHALLHEEHADERRGRADDDARRAARAACTCGRTATGSAHGIPGSPPISASSSSQSGRSSRCTPRLTPVAARSAGGPSNSTRRLSTITRSRSSATAPSSCDTSSTAARCSLHEVHERVAEQLAATRRRRRRSARRARAARARRRAPCAISTRCCCPPESSCSRLRRWSVSATDSSAWSTASRSAARRRRHQPCFARRPVAHDLLDRGGEVGRDARPLRHVARRASGRASSRGRHAEHRDRSARGGASRPSRIRSSVDLPEPFGPGERGELAGAHLEAHVVEHQLGAVARTTRRRPRARTGSASRGSAELSMILIMAGRRSRSHHGRRECRVDGPRPRRTPATTTATPCGAPRRSNVGPAVGRARRSPSPSWWWRRSPRSSTGSLALLSDAAHMLTDGVAIALALGAIVVANRASQRGRRAPSGCSGSRSSRRS